MSEVLSDVILSSKINSGLPVESFFVFLSLVPLVLEQTWVFLLVISHVNFYSQIFFLIYSI